MEEEDPVGEVPSQGYKVVAFRSCLSLTDSVEHQIQRSLVLLPNRLCYQGLYNKYQFKSQNSEVLQDTDVSICNLMLLCYELC